MIAKPDVQPWLSSRYSTTYDPTFSHFLGFAQSANCRSQEKLFAPIRIALSPTLLKAYLRTALTLVASTGLFVTAIIAYISFYYTYIPVRSIAVPIYLQFPTLPHVTAVTSPATPFPYGVAKLKGLVGQQKYDVVVEVDMPRRDRKSVV